MVSKMPLGAMLFLAAQLATAGTLRSIVYEKDTKSLDPRLGELCSVAPSGGASECLDGKGYVDPAWQPHGRRVVVSHYGPGKNHALVLLDMHGRKLDVLVHSAGYMSPIVWSPDGKYVYAINPRDAHAIGRWDSNGKHFTLIPVRGVACDKDARAIGLACEKQSIQELSFSPSGKHAALVAMAEGSQYIADVRNHEIVARRILPKGFALVGPSLWLDETRLLFIGFKNNGAPSRLWKINIHTGKLKSLGNGGLALTLGLALSPDRRSVVVEAGKATANTRRVPRITLWRYSLYSGATRQLTHGTFDVSPSWRH